MKFNTNIRYIKKTIKNLKINTNNLKIRALKKDCITANTKDIFFSSKFSIYINRFFFSSYPKK